MDNLSEHIAHIQTSKQTNLPSISSQLFESKPIQCEIFTGLIIWRQQTAAILSSLHSTVMSGKLSFKVQGSFHQTLARATFLLLFLGLLFLLHIGI